jgi:hypothetical protein
VPDERVGVVQRQPQVLAAALHRADRPASQDIGEVHGPRGVAADRARVPDLDARDRPAGDPLVQAAADRFNFW